MRVATGYSAYTCSAWQAFFAEFDFSIQALSPAADPACAKTSRAAWSLPFLPCPSSNECICKQLATPFDSRKQRLYRSSMSWACLTATVCHFLIELVIFMSWTVASVSTPKLPPPTTRQPSLPYGQTVCAPTTTSVSKFYFQGADCISLPAPEPSLLRRDPSCCYIFELFFLSVVNKFISFTFKSMP